MRDLWLLRVLFIHSPALLNGRSLAAARALHTFSSTASCPTMSWSTACIGHYTDPDSATCFVDIHQDWANTTRITKLNSHISEAYCQQ